MWYLLKITDEFILILLIVFLLQGPPGQRGPVGASGAKGPMVSKCGGHTTLFVEQELICDFRFLGCNRTTGAPGPTGTTRTQGRISVLVVRIVVEALVFIYCCGIGCF